MASQAKLPVDMELKKAFQELQMKMITTSSHLRVSDAQIEGLKRQIHHSQLVEREISGFPETVKTYEGIGRMFLLTPIPEVMENLKKKKTNAEEKITLIEKQKEYLEKSLKESEASLRELVLSKQQGR